MRRSKIGNGDRMTTKIKVYRVNGIEVSRSVPDQQLVQLAKSCPPRGDQLRTMTSDICGTRGHAVPVYACAMHGECTHRQACKGQDASVRICLGCTDGPWAAE